MWSVTTHSDADTRRLAARVAPHLRGGDVLALDGPLGSGKTCFVRGLAEALGVERGDVSSPTFTLCQQYDDRRGRPVLAHLDAYRLSGPDELDSIGWEELLDDGRLVVAVEWADRIEPALPADRVALRFEHAGERARRITLAAFGNLAERLVDLDLAGAAEESDAPCPICGSRVAADGGHAPFCSARCRGADLNRWFTGAYALSRPLRADDDL